MGKPPFLIFGLPRSRTAWLSRFLSYGDWNCGHDQVRYMRSLDDVKAWLSQENTGTCETGAAPFWRLVLKYRPDIRVITVRRPVEEVLESLSRLKPQSDAPVMRKMLTALDRKLDQIERRVPNARSVKFKNLQREVVCGAIFEHCLPYKHDPHWWRALAGVNIQINFAALVRYVQANKAAIEKLTAQARQMMLMDMALRPAVTQAVDIREESVDDVERDCQHLFREHCAAVGEHPDNWKNKNIPLMRKLHECGALQVMVGRSNGKAFGYLMTIIAPSLESTSRTSSQHGLFYASPSMPGLGLKLQRAALAALRQKGVDETWMHANTRGSGDRIDILYRRLGAQDVGHLYRVELAA